jgi:ferritin-like metal-binding protein YciE
MVNLDKSKISLMEIKTLQNLFVMQLKDIFSVEKQLIEAFPKIIKEASNKELKTILREHLDQTKVQALRVQKILQELGNLKFSEENSNIMEGMLDELEDQMEENSGSDILDAEIISAFQKIEHYEIASYSSVLTYAKMLGNEAAVEILQESLDEEYEADNKLDKVNEEIVNVYVKH